MQSTQNAQRTTPETKHKEESEEIPWGPIGKEVYERTYARLKDDGTAETWDETVARVIAGNCALADDYEPVTDLERRALTDMMTNFKIMPAGRHLWVSGVQDRQYLFNCHHAGWTLNLEDHCEFLFIELMRGGGVGANYSLAKAYIPGTAINLFVCSDRHKDYARFSELLDSQTSAAVMPQTAIRYTVEDSKEGWVRALKHVIVSHFGGPPAVLDFSDVRPLGERIRGFGGTASGPAALIKMLKNVDAILNDCAGKKLRPLTLMDIDHQIAACVIAGNVRRSARMSILHWTDPSILNFLACKLRGDEHWTTNISVELDKAFWQAYNNGNALARNVLKLIAQGMKHNGEPGIFNSHLANVGERRPTRSTNPCGEIALEEWENCNLGHINLARAVPNDFEFLKTAAILMTRFLIRATLSPDINEMQRHVIERNRRIGVGFYGYQKWVIDCFGIPYSKSHKNNEVRAVLGRLRNIIDLEAAKYAKHLGINTPIKTTTIAPTGTISLLSGDTPGIQPIFAKRFIRRIRYAATDEALGQYSDEQIEDDLVSADTKVVTTVCEDALMSSAHNPELVESSFEVSLKDQLAVQAMIQYVYANNAVSFTASLNGESTADIIDVLEQHGPRVKGSTMFPRTSFKQAPFERITEDRYNALSEKYGSSVSNNEDECVTGCPIR